MVTSQPMSHAASICEWGVAVGSGLGWYAQVSTYFLFCVLPRCSFSVTASPSPWHG